MHCDYALHAVSIHFDWDQVLPAFLPSSTISRRRQRQLVLNPALKTARLRLAS